MAGLCWKGGHRTESVPYVHLLPHKTSPNSQAAPMQMLGRPEESEAQAAHVFARPWGCVEAMPHAMQIKVKNLTPFIISLRSLGPEKEDRNSPCCWANETVSLPKPFWLSLKCCYSCYSGQISGRLYSSLGVAHLSSSRS